MGPPLPTYAQRKTLACLSAVRSIIEKLGEVPKWTRLAEMTGYLEYLIKKALSQWQGGSYGSFKLWPIGPLTDSASAPMVNQGGYLVTSLKNIAHVWKTI